ncbi:MAG TPA: sigma-70 family RNA polymerase sigma factor [Candidatus Polarisedimenticolia bacterium]|nr:sigma-70 family RNA polymerase sigma factor [Candidatus Polarisedimenticolia bacterium]
MPYPEHSIARRLLENDPKALSELFRWISIALTSPRFWSLRSEWPDLVQEVLARVVESLQKERFDVNRDFRAYVQGIARHVSHQALTRQIASRAPEDVPVLESRSTDPEASAISRQLVRRVLDLASEDCRDLIRVYFYEARSYEEIAASYHLAVGTIKSRLFRCLERAHEALRVSIFRNRAKEKV